MAIGTQLVGKFDHLTLSGDFSYNLDLIQEEKVLFKRHYLFPFDSMTLSGKWVYNLTSSVYDGSFSSDRSEQLDCYRKLGGNAEPNEG